MFHSFWYAYQRLTAIHKVGRWAQPISSSPLPKNVPAAWRSPAISEAISPSLRCHRCVFQMRNVWHVEYITSWLHISYVIHHGLGIYHGSYHQLIMMSGIYHYISCEYYSQRIRDVVFLKAIQMVRITTEGHTPAMTSAPTEVTQSPKVLQFQ